MTTLAGLAKGIWPLDADIIIIGAGLASALVAARLATEANPPSILVLERSSQPFGEHTWSFHQHDLSDVDHGWLSPLVAIRWPRHRVSFQNFERVLEASYLSLTSKSVARHIGSLPNVTIRTDADVSAMGPRSVTLSDGRTFSSSCVIDARGFEDDPALRLGFQKFVGIEFKTKVPHGLEEPMLMDATVPQQDGYRFIYCLPFSPTRVLVEDTRYSDGPGMDEMSFEDGIGDYVRSRGWQVETVIRREKGALPIALAIDAERFWKNRPSDVATIGMRAALFHPTTGYSLPDAADVANLVKNHWREGSLSLASSIRKHAIRRVETQAFYRMLNRMLFTAAQPLRRHVVFERFYRLPQPLIENFYAGSTTFFERARILTGKPPVPVGKALACLSESRFLKRVAHES
jgi:lycopene beta-cyclase